MPKTGYRFVGWQSDNGGSFANGTAAETTFTMPANPVNVYAVFEAVEYTITTQVSGSGSVNCSKTKAKYGESVTLTAVPAAGYVFKGWVSGDVTIADPSAKSITIKMPAKNITVTAKFEKESAKGTLADVTLTKTSYTYTGSAIKPGMTVTAVVNGSTVTLTSAQFKVTYSNNVKVGTATVTVTGVDNITGSISKTFKITKVKLYSAKVINASLPYNGKEHKPILTVKAKVNGVLKTLTKKTDYTATYSNNVEPGTATVTVKGKGNYTGTIKTTFKINKLKMSAAVVTLSKTTMTYTGKALKPKVTVKYKIGSKMVTLTKGIDYTVTYKDNIEAGTATVIIKGKGHFTGTQKVTFTIRRR
ncbi:MAG: InlB B-repeat-containing protein [Clostridia bacterium]|nr:InlB B-repeat-containing protein [Clostridia bacterium]